MPLSRLLFDKISYLDPQAHVNIVLSLLKLTLDSVKVVVIDSAISFLINITTSTFAISFLSFYRFWSVLPTNQHLTIQLQTRLIKKKKKLWQRMISREIFTWFDSSIVKQVNQFMQGREFSIMVYLSDQYYTKSNLLVTLWGS